MRILKSGFFCLNSQLRRNGNVSYFHCGTRTRVPIQSQSTKCCLRYVFFPKIFLINSTTHDDIFFCQLICTISRVTSVCSYFSSHRLTLSAPDARSLSKRWTLLPKATIQQNTAKAEKKSEYIRKA